MRPEAPAKSRARKARLTFVQDLQEDVRHVLVGFLKLVEQNDGIRAPANLLGQLTGLLEPHVARSGTDQARYSVLVLVFTPVSSAQNENDTISISFSEKW